MKNFKKLFQFFIFLFLLIAYNNIIYSQWSQVGQVSGFGGGLPRISVADSNVVWVAGGTTTNPFVYKTVNGGLNWTSIPTSGLPYFVSSLTAKDSINAFVADAAGGGLGGNAKFFKTTNAGLNWILIDSTGENWGYHGIVFSKTVPSFGIAQSAPPNGQGTPYHLNITTNGGITWKRQSAPGVAEYFGLRYTPFVIDSLFYGFAIATPTLPEPQIMDSYITSNGGNNWYRGFEALKGLSGGDIVFNDNKFNGIMMYGNFLPNIKLTTNGGVNWAKVSTMTNISGICGASWISGTNTVFICAANNISGNNIIRSDNGGLNWTEQTTSGRLYIREIDYIRYGNKVIAYAVNRDGIILKSRQDVVITGITKIESKIPLSFSLFQNYPNPFNPTTKLKFEVPSNRRREMTNIKLFVYDALGKEVRKLVDQKLNSGSYEVEFNGTNFSSGVYFYKLMSEDYIETKKMFLTK